MFVDGYVVEVHVPAAEIKRLLAEKPDAIGLTPIGVENAPRPRQARRSQDLFATARFLWNGLFFNRL